LLTPFLISYNMEKLKIKILDGSKFGTDKIETGSVLNLPFRTANDLIKKGFAEEFKAPVKKVKKATVKK